MLIPTTPLVGHIEHQLGPGFYVTESGTPAFHQVLSAIASGEAQLTGERYIDTDTGLKKIVTVRSGQGHTATNPAIGLGQEFFSGAIKDYRDWKIKWWREVVQNSVDADATEIHLDAHKSPDGTWVITCRDNGGGMSERVLVDSFLVLGGSTKKGQAGQAGGFGKAKELILLPWIEWWVRTGDTHVVGAGASYYDVRDQSQEAEEFFRSLGYTERPSYPGRLNGTEIRVVMPPDEHTGESEAIAFIEKCYLPSVKFRVNGKIYRGKLASTKLVETVPGKIDVYHVEKKGMDGYGIMVRTNGLFMFTIGYQSMSDGQLVAEITAPSIEILTANRDGFRDGMVRHALDNLGTLIAKDVKSALRSKKGIIRKKFISGGKFQGAKRLESEILSRVHNLVPNKQGKLESGSMETLLETIIDTRGSAPPPPVEAVDMLNDDSRPVLHRRGPPMDTDIQEREEIRLLVTDLMASGYDAAVGREMLWWGVEEVEDLAMEVLGGDAVLSAQKKSIKIAQGASLAQAETVHSISSVQPSSAAAIMDSVHITGVNHAENAIKQLVWEPDFYLCNEVEGWTPQKRFYPETMTPKLNKLARVWTELCRFVLIQLNSPLPFGVGWIFDTGALAAYQGSDPDDKYAQFRSGGEHWLLLNPFVHNGNPRVAGFYSPTKKADIRKLAALAIHEATHMADGISYHDESFTSALTRNMALCADIFKHAPKIARSVKMSGKARADRR